MDNVTEREAVVGQEPIRECPAPWCDDLSEVEVTGYRCMEFVVCGHCGCTGPEGSSPEEAIKLWNDRADNRALKAGEG